MPKLYTFGCSFTFGDGLPDIYPNHAQPSKLGWSYLLGDMLGVEVVNCGVSGAGNNEILAKLLTSPLTADDYCVVLWSSFDRYEQYKFGLDIHIGFRQGIERFTKENNIDHPFWIHNNRTRNWFAIQHASLYLAHKGVKFCTALGIVNPEPITYPKPSIDIINFVDVDPIDWIIDRGLDADGHGGGHPGLESQRLLAKLIYDRIEK